jgi:RNA-directed DNA polymerase
MEQAKRIASPRDGKSELEEIRLYNAMVMGMQNYYCLATDISDDFNQLNHSVMTILTNRLNTEKGCRLVRKGRPLTEIKRQRYGRSKRLRYVAGTGEPIYPIGQVRRIRPRCKQRSWCSYTPEGRVGLYDNLRINVHLMLKLMRQPLGNRSIEYADNRISLFCSQWGKCAVTGKPFRSTKEIHCHHIKPRHCGGGDEYGNLILVHETIHKLIHATRRDTIMEILKVLKLNEKQIQKVNGLRKSAGLCSIYQATKSQK